MLLLLLLSSSITIVSLSHKINRQIIRWFTMKNEGDIWCFYVIFWDWFLFYLLLYIWLFWLYSDCWWGLLWWLSSRYAASYCVGVMSIHLSHTAARIESNEVRWAKLCFDVQNVTCEMSTSKYTINRAGFDVSGYIDSVTLPCYLNIKACAIYVFSLVNV